MKKKKAHQFIRYLHTIFVSETLELGVTDKPKYRAFTEGVFERINLDSMILFYSLRYSLSKNRE